MTRMATVKKAQTENAIKTKGAPSPAGRFIMAGRPIPTVLMILSHKTSDNSGKAGKYESAQTTHHPSMISGDSK